MTLRSIDDLLAGFSAPTTWMRNMSAGGDTMKAGHWQSLWYTRGAPGAGSASTAGLSGEALDGGSSGRAVPGQIWCPSFDGIEGTIAKFHAHGFGTGLLSLMVADRLFVNSGISSTSTSPQTVNSVAWPSRDANGGTNGVGVGVALEWSVASSYNSTPRVATLTFTDSDDNNGLTSALTLPTQPQVGTFVPFALGLVGSAGVKSIQSLQLDGSMTNGTMHLVAYRSIVQLPIPTVGGVVTATLAQLGYPRIYDGTVPWGLFMGDSNVTANPVFDLCFSTR